MLFINEEQRYEFLLQERAIKPCYIEINNFMPFSVTNRVEAQTRPNIVTDHAKGTSNHGSMGAQSVSIPDNTNPSWLSSFKKTIGSFFSWNSSASIADTRTTFSETPTGTAEANKEQRLKFSTRVYNFFAGLVPSFAFPGSEKAALNKPADKMEEARNNAIAYLCPNYTEKTPEQSQKERNSNAINVLLKAIKETSPALEEEYQKYRAHIELALCYYSNNFLSGHEPPNPKQAAIDQLELAIPNEIDGNPVTNKDEVATHITAVFSSTDEAAKATLKTAIQNFHNKGWGDQIAEEAITKVSNLLTQACEATNPDQKLQLEDEAEQVLMNAVKLLNPYRLPTSTRPNVITQESLGQAMFTQLKEEAAAKVKPPAAVEIAKMKKAYRLLQRTPQNEDKVINILKEIACTRWPNESDEVHTQHAVKELERVRKKLLTISKEDYFDWDYDGEESN